MAHICNPLTPGRLIQEGFPSSVRDTEQVPGQYSLHSKALLQKPETKTKGKGYREEKHRVLLSVYQAASCSFTGQGWECLHGVLSACM